MSPFKIMDSSWKIVTVNEPVMMHRTDDEVWLLNPHRRYILNPAQIHQIEQFVGSVSDLQPGGLLNPLRNGQNIAKSRILIERLRERGVGDLLFLTGPLAFLQQASGQTAEIDVYALADRGTVLWGNTDARVLCGPVEYDHLRLYNQHWFVNSVTENDEEPDQPNVYDALYAQLGFDPASIDAIWKRPKAFCSPDDYRNLDQFYRSIWEAKKVDLRRVGFYVVCPFAAATVRSMSYVKWLKFIGELGKRRPVLVCGSTKVKQPDTDMSAGAFLDQINGLGGGVINAMDSTPLRVLMALISRVKAFLGLVSGPLYIAQAMRIPAISLWGCHAPGSRLQYDKTYMELAVWERSACNQSPCFTYIDFPAAKCPRGAGQTECEVLSVIQPENIFTKFDLVESATK